jgi:hypothetical protein
MPATPLLINHLVGFYINLPFGAATAVLLFFFFHPRRDDNSLRFRQKLLRLDLPGFLIFHSGSTHVASSHRMGWGKISMALCHYNRAAMWLCWNDGRVRSVAMVSKR